MDNLWSNVFIGPFETTFSNLYSVLTQMPYGSFYYFALICFFVVKCGKNSFVDNEIKISSKKFAIHLMGFFDCWAYVMLNTLIHTWIKIMHKLKKSLHYLCFASLFKLHIPPNICPYFHRQFLCISSVIFKICLLNSWDIFLCWD